MWVIVWYEEENYLAKVKHKVKGSGGNEGKVEVRCLKMPFRVRQVPQDFEEEEHHCFYKKVYWSTVKSVAIFHKDHTSGFIN